MRVLVADATRHGATAGIEIRGLLLRALQVPLLLILVWLAATPRDIRPDVGRVAPG